MVRTVGIAPTDGYGLCPRRDEAYVGLPERVHDRGPERRTDGYRLSPIWSA